MGVQEIDLSDEKTTPNKQTQVPKKITKKDLLRGVEFFNQIQRRLKKHPRMMRKFCDVIIENGNTHDQEILETNLSVLLDKYPELVTEFFNFCSGSDENKAEDNGVKNNDMDDALYEADMVMHWMISAKEATQRLFEAFQKNPSEKIEVTTYLTRMNLRSVEQLYGNEGAAMLVLLHQSPGTASSIILPRLSQKLEEIIAKKVEIRSKAMQSHMAR